MLSAKMDDTRVGRNRDDPEWAFGYGRMLVPFLPFRVLILLVNENIVP